jgi:hypothetical protein
VTSREFLLEDAGPADYDATKEVTCGPGSGYPRGPGVVYSPTKQSGRTPTAEITMGSKCKKKLMLDTRAISSRWRAAGAERAVRTAEARMENLPLALQTSPCNVTLPTRRREAIGR